MPVNIRSIILPVQDLNRAKAMYSKLFGVQPYIDESYYVAFNVAGQDVGLDPNRHRGMTGPIAYWNVTDIHQTIQQLVDDGGEVQQDVHDVGGGMVVAIVKDPSGNVIGLAQ
jgi:predicted enzyme related to lactoylglutathione lyase